MTISLSSSNRYYISNASNPSLPENPTEQVGVTEEDPRNATRFELQVRSIATELQLQIKSAELEQIDNRLKNIFINRSTPTPPSRIGPPVDLEDMA